MSKPPYKHRAWRVTARTREAIDAVLTQTGQTQQAWVHAAVLEWVNERLRERADDPGRAPMGRIELPESARESLRKLRRSPTTDPRLGVWIALMSQAGWPSTALALWGLSPEAVADLRTSGNVALQENDGVADLYRTLPAVPEVPPVLQAVDNEHLDGMLNVKMDVDLLERLRDVSEVEEVPISAAARLAFRERLLSDGLDPSGLTESAQAAAGTTTP